MAPTCQCQIAYSKAPPFRTEVATCLVASDPRGAMSIGAPSYPKPCYKRRSWPSQCPRGRVISFQLKTVNHDDILLVS